MAIADIELDINSKQLLMASIRTMAVAEIAALLHSVAKDQFAYTSDEDWYAFREIYHRWTPGGDMALSSYITGTLWRIYQQQAIASNIEFLDDQDSETLPVTIRNIGFITAHFRTPSFVNAVMKESRLLFTKSGFIGMLDEQKHLLGFKNGVYDFRAHEFRAGKPSDYISLSTNINFIRYVPDSKEAIEINQFIDDIFPNPALNQYWRDLMVNVIDASITMNKFHILLGAGSNGKSACISLLQGALGEYWFILPIGLLTQKRPAFNAPIPELEMAKGRLLGVIREPDPGSVLNTGLLKELTGGDPVMARRIFKQPIMFKPQYKLIMVGNSLPDIHTNSSALWDRIKVINFETRFVGEKAVYGPNEKLKNPEIMNNNNGWVEMFMAMMIEHHKTIAKHIVVPQIVEDAVKKYKLWNNPFDHYAGLASLRVDPTDTAIRTIRAIYTDFVLWFRGCHRGTPVPTLCELKVYLEATYLEYPKGGWVGLHFEKTSTVDTQSKATLQDIAYMETHLCIDELSNEKSKDLEAFRKKHCKSVSREEMDNYIVDILELKPSKNLVRDGKRGIRGYEGMRITQ